MHARAWGVVLRVCPSLLPRTRCCTGCTQSSGASNAAAKVGGRAPSECAGAVVTRGCAGGSSSSRPGATASGTAKVSGSLGRGKAGAPGIVAIVSGSRGVEKHAGSPPQRTPSAGRSETGPRAPSNPSQAGTPPAQAGQVEQSACCCALCLPLVLARWRVRLLRLTGQLERGRARQRRHRQHVVAQLGGQLYWSKEGRGSTSGCRAAQRVPLHVAASSKTLPAWRRTCSRSRAPPTVTPASSSAGNAGNKSTPGTAAAAAASTSALAGSVMASPCCWCLHGVCVGGGRAVCMRTAS